MGKVQRHGVCLSMRPVVAQPVREGKALACALPAATRAAAHHTTLRPPPSTCRVCARCTTRARCPLAMAYGRRSGTSSQILWRCGDAAVLCKCCGTRTSCMLVHNAAIPSSPCRLTGRLLIPCQSQVLMIDPDTEEPIKFEAI